MSMDQNKLKEILDHMFTEFDVELNALADRANTIELGLFKRYVVDFRNNNAMVSLLEDIELDVMQNNLIQERIIQKDEEIDRLREVVAELEKYKTYYDMEQGMRHNIAPTSHRE